MLHRVETQRQVLLGKVLVDVQGIAPQLVGTHGDTAGDEIFGLGALAHQVDRPAGRAPATVGRARPLDDLHRLDVERFVRRPPQVAQAVDLDIGTGFETADERPVPQRGAPLAGPQGNARGGAQNIGQGCGATLLDQGFVDDSDRFWRFTQRCGELR
ncbi:hypothetical protein D3C80_1660760 [compost metagenome]